MFVVWCEIKGETLSRGFFLRAAEQRAAHRGTGSVLEQAALQAGVERTQGLLSLVPTNECSGVRFIFLASTSGLTLCE